MKFGAILAHLGSLFALSKNKHFDITSPTMGHSKRSKSKSHKGHFLKTILKRRKKNKTARISRRINRLRLA